MILFYNKLYTIFILSIFIIITASSIILAEQLYIYLDNEKISSVPAPIYSAEKKKDFFTSSEAPPKSFKVIKIDLNKDGNDEYFVSNPNNNGAFHYFWRIYQKENKSFKEIGEMGCTSIRITNDITDYHKDIDCYTHISLVEGYLFKYRHFGNEYHYKDKKRIASRHYYQNN